MIVVHEGGKDSPKAWKAALNYLQAAMRLGGMWLQYNDFTKRVDILYVKKTRRTIFQQKWAMFTESTRKTNHEVDAGAATEPEVPETPDQKRLRLAKPGVRAEPAAKRARGAGAPQTEPEGPSPAKSPGKLGTKEKTKPSQQDKENQKLLKTCQSLKTTYLKVSTVQTNMLKILGDHEPADVAWAPLANPTNIANLTYLMSKVDASAKGAFPYSFLNGDVVELKKDYNGKMIEFWFNLRSFESSFSVAIKCLDVEQKRLNRMYRAGKQ